MKDCQAVEGSRQTMSVGEGRNAGFPPHATWEHPHSFQCPISRHCMHDPVVLADGHSYERSHIECWLQQRSSSPVSGLELPQRDVFPNHALRNAIEEYFQQVFGSHRRAIRDAIAESPQGQELDQSMAFVRGVDSLMHCALYLDAGRGVECFLQRVIGQAGMLVGAKNFGVLCVDASRQQLYSTTASATGELRIPITTGIAGRVAMLGESLLIHDPQHDGRFDESVDAVGGAAPRGVMCVPLRVKGNVIGVAQLMKKTDTGAFAAEAPGGGAPPAFSASDLELLDAIAVRASRAIDGSGALDAAQPEPAPSLDTAEEDMDAGEEAAFPRRQGSRIARQRRHRLRAACAHDAEAAVAQSLLALLSGATGGWQLDVALLVELTKNKPLSTLSTHLFDHLGFFERFPLDREKFVSFMAEIERGYDDANPYHNRAHAASVVHMVYALLQHGGIAAAAAGQTFGDAAAGDGTAGDGAAARGDSVDMVMVACVLAAAIHDYAHPGVNNDFLVKTQDERALHHNDQHVNEHHSVAAAFALLQRPKYDFMGRLPPGTYRQIRRLVIDLVLGTDMASNGMLLGSFTEAVGAATRTTGDSSSGVRAEPGAEGAPFVPATARDATLLLQVAIKCADLCHMTIGWDAHLGSVRQLEEEFFAQGDREKDLELPVSFLMDREQPGVSTTQVGFLAHVALPLFRVLARAAPAARPALSGVEENHRRWREVEARTATGTGAEAAAH